MEELDSRTYTPMPVSLIESTAKYLDDWIAQFDQGRIAFLPNSILHMLFETQVFYLCTEHVEECMQPLA